MLNINGKTLSSVFFAYMVRGAMIGEEEKEENTTQEKLSLVKNTWPVSSCNKTSIPDKQLSLFILHMVLSVGRYKIENVIEIQHLLLFVKTFCILVPFNINNVARGRIGVMINTFTVHVGRPCLRLCCDCFTTTVMAERISKSQKVIISTVAE